MLKNRIFRLLSVFCFDCNFNVLSYVQQLLLLMSLSARWRRYMLMYLITICTLTVQCTHENAGDSLSISEDNIPNGVVYSDIVNFDANENPYLVIFLADSGYTTASCHVWKYDEETENAERIAILDVITIKYRLVNRVYFLSVQTLKNVI